MPYPAKQRRGLFVIGLFVGQVVLGLFIHYIHIPVRFFGHRPPQNFFHAVQGLVILGLANYQVRLCRRCLLHKLLFFSSVLGSFTTAYITKPLSWLLMSDRLRSALGLHWSS